MGVADRLGGREDGVCITLPAFTPLEDSLFLTLYARALDNRRPHQLVREILLSREPEVAEFPPFWRRYHRLAAHSTAWSRTGTIVLHYRF